MSENISNNSSKTTQFTSINESHDWNQLLQWMENNPDDLIMWIENQPEYQDLIEKAKKGESSLNTGSVMDSGPVKNVKDLFWIDSTKLYGKADVSKELIEDSATTATTMSVANIINVFSTVPLLQYAFGGIGMMGQGFAVILGILILKISNSFGEAAAANRPNNQGWSTTGFAGFLSVNLLLSLIAPPGIELLLGQTQLAEARAAELIEKNNLRKNLGSKEQEILEQKIAGFEKDKNNLEEEFQEDRSRAQQKIDEIDKNINQKERDLSNPPYYQVRLSSIRSAISKLRAEKKAIDSELEKSRTSISSGQRAIDKKIADSQEKLAKLRENRIDSVTNRGFLQKVQSGLYDQEFDDDGFIKKENGTIATRLAIELTLTNLQNGNFKSLGFALFFFSLSMITSLAATAKAFAHSQRKDVINSWNTRVIQQREELFQAALRGITKRMI